MPAQMKKILQWKERCKLNSELIIKNPEQSHRPGRVLLALLAVFVILISACVPVFAADANANGNANSGGTTGQSQNAAGAGTNGTTGTDDTASGGGSSGIPNAYYLSDSVLSDVDPNHSFYKDNSQYNVTSFGRIIGIALSNLNYRVAKWAYETFFVNAYKALGFTNWNGIIRNTIFGGHSGYRAALIGLVTVGMIALGIQMLYRQEEMVSSRRAVVKQIIAVLLIIFGMPFLLNILSNVALAGASAATSAGQSQLGLDDADKDSYFNSVIRENVIDWEYVAARGALGVCDGVREAPSNKPAAKTPAKASLKDPPVHQNELTGAIYRRCLAIPDYYQLSTSKKSINNISYIDPGSITNGLSDIQYDEVLTEKTLNVAKNPAAMVVSLARRYNEDVLNASIALGQCYAAAQKESTGNGVDFKRMTTGWHPSFDAHYDDYVRYVRDAELVAKSLQHYWPTDSTGKIHNVGKKDDTAKNGVQRTYVETEDEGTQLIAPVESGTEATIMYGQIIPKTNSGLLESISKDMYNQFVKRSANSKDSNKKKFIVFNNERSHYAYCGRLVLIEVNEGAENQEGADAVDKLAGKAALEAGKNALQASQAMNNGEKKHTDAQQAALEQGKNLLNAPGIITMPQLGAIPVQAKPKKTNPATSTTKKQDDTSTTTAPNSDANGLDPSLTGGTTGSSDGGDNDQNTITSVRLMNPNAGCRVTDPKVDPYIWKGLNTDGTMQDTVKTFLLHDREGNQVDSSGAVGKQMGGAKVAPYYRYSIDFLAIALECLALALAYIALAYKILRTIFDIVLTSIVAPFFASVDFASQGTKTKEILKGILQAYVTLLYYPIVIDVYMIGCRYIQQTWGGADDTKLFYLFILFAWSIAMIDTPVILGNLLGQQMQRSFINDLSTLTTGINQGLDLGGKVMKAGGKGLKALGKAGSALAGAIGPEGAGILGAAAATGAAFSAFNKSGDVKGLANNLKNASAQLDAANTTKSLQSHPARKALKGSSGGTPPIGAWFNQPAQADTKSALIDRSSKSKSTAAMKQLEAKNSGALPEKTAVEDVSPLIQQAKKAAPLGATAAMFGAAEGKAHANANAKAKAGGGTTTSKSKTTKTISNSSVSHREASQTTALRNAAGAGVAGAAAGAVTGKQVSEGKMDRQHTKETQVNEKNTRSATSTTRSQIRQERAAVLNHAAAGGTVGTVAGTAAHTAAIDSTTTAGMQAMPMTDLAQTVAQEPIAEPLNMVATAPGATDTHSTATHHQTVQAQAHTSAQRTMETQDRNIHTTIQQNRAQVSNQSAVTSSSTAQHTVHTNTITSTTGSSVDTAIPQIASTATSISSMAMPSVARQAEPVYASTQAGAPSTSNQTIHVLHQTMPGTNTTVDAGEVSALPRVSQPIHQTATQTMHVMADISGSAAPATITQSISSMAAPSAGSASTVNQHVVQEQAASSMNHTVNQTTTVQGASAPGGGTTTVRQTVVQEAATPSSGNFGGGGSFYTTDNAPSSVRPEITHDYTPNVQPASPSRMDLPNLQHVASNGYTSTAPAAPSAPAAAPAETIFDMLSTAAASEGNLGSQAADILRERSAQVKSYASNAPKLRKERKG